jgi:hypothetical protein
MWADELYDPEFYDASFVEQKTDSTKSIYQNCYYQSNTALNKRILNAITGQEYEYRIGSEDEKRFYILMVQDPWDPKESCRLFFSSPQAAENFDGLPVCQESIDRFNKNKEYFRLKDMRKKV